MRKKRLTIIGLSTGIMTTEKNKNIYYFDLKSIVSIAENSNMGYGDLVPRIITDFRIHIARADSVRFKSAASVNLSETGLCLRVLDKLEMGERVRVRIRLDPDSVSMETAGKVVWVRPDRINERFYCGIGFENLTPDQLCQIQNYTKIGTKWLVQFLCEFPLFQDFSEQDCYLLLRIITLRQLEKKEILYYDGTNTADMQGLFIVHSGMLNIFKGSKPRPERHLAVVSPGQVFGETTLVNDQEHTATIMAINESRLIQINKVGFMLMRKEQPELGLKIMEVVARALATRLGRTTKKLFSPIRL